MDITDDLKTDIASILGVDTNELSDSLTYTSAVELLCGHVTENDLETYSDSIFKAAEDFEKYKLHYDDDVKVDATDAYDKYLKHMVAIKKIQTGNEDQPRVRYMLYTSLLQFLFDIHVPYNSVETETINIVGNKTYLDEAIGPYIVDPTMQSPLPTSRSTDDPPGAPVV